MVSNKGATMQITTAIKHLQKDAEFLGMPLLETLLWFAVTTAPIMKRTLRPI
jgi:hypothetical protein